MPRLPGFSGNETLPPSRACSRLRQTGVQRRHQGIPAENPDAEAVRPYGEGVVSSAAWRLALAVLPRRYGRHCSEPALGCGRHGNGCHDRGHALEQPKRGQTRWVVRALMPLEYPTRTSPE